MILRNKHFLLSSFHFDLIRFRFNGRYFPSSVFCLLSVLLISSCKTTESSTAYKIPDAKVNDVIGEDPKQTEFENTFLEGKKQEILGNADKALAIYRDLLKQQPENDVVNFQIGNILYAQHKYLDALPYLKISVKQNPSNKYYEQLYAELLNHTGNPKGAAGVYEYLSKQSPNDVDYLFNYAYFLSLTGDFQKAIDTYNKIESQVGVSEDLSMAKQQLYMKLGKKQAAIDEIQKLSDANPGEAHYLAMLADLYTGLGQNDKAMEVIEKLGKADPNNAQAQLSLAAFYRKNGEDEKYFEAMKNVFASRDMNIDTKIKVLLEYLQYLNDEKRKTEALALGKILVDTHPNEAKAHAMYADVMNQLSMDVPALEEYQKALKVDDSKFTVWQQVLILESSLNLKDSLLHDAQRCLEIFPNQGLPHYMIGVSNLQNKKYNEALSEFSQAIMIGSDDKVIMSQLYSGLGDVYAGMKKNTSSDSCYELALTYDEGNTHVMNNYAYQLSLRGEKLDKAVSLITKALAKNPDDAGYLDTYGWILYKQKKYSEAKTQIEKSLQHGGEKDPAISEHYGDVLFQLGETDNAMEYWLKAKAMNPDSEFLDKKIAEKKLYE